MLDELKSADFSAHLNQPFQISLGPDETLPLDLIEVNELSQNRAGLKDESAHKAFSLIFKSAEDMLIPQQIYRISHEKMGDLDLFLVQVAANKYEAVFT